MLRFICLPLFILFASSNSFAWGARGHSIVCETAAYLASADGKHRFLKSHSLDFGYYCNVPDFIWKRPETYKKEFSNHFMNLEVYERELGQQGWRNNDSPFMLSRHQFEKKYPKLEAKRGRSWWRIRELAQTLQTITKDLRNKKIKGEKRKERQADWIMTAGIMGHYIGDLAMPLHVSENYDGQLTGQIGIHHHFEGLMVQELYLRPDFGLQAEVFKRAHKKWPDFIKRYQKWDVNQAVMDLSFDSKSHAKELLDLDKKVGRKDVPKATAAFKELIIERLVQGALYQALFLHHSLGWNFDQKNFFLFREHPQFIEP